MLLLQGTFYITGTIRTYQNLTLEGSGYNTLLYLVKNSNCIVISNEGGWNIPRANVAIRNLRIDGNRANQSSGDGILRTGANATCENLWVENCAGKGICQRFCDYSRVANCTVRNCKGRGIFLEEPHWAEISGNKVYNCGLMSGSTEDKAIDIYAGADNRILNNYIEGGGVTRQLGAWLSPRVEISGNTLVNGLGMGIAPISQYGKILNNTITNAGNNAIDTCGADDNRIEGNTISHVDRVALGASDQENSGIALNSKRTVVINNRIEYCGRAGIHIGPNHNNNQILNNVIKNCGRQGYGVAGIWVQVWTSNGVNSGTIIRGNTIYDDQSKKTQKYGIWLDPMSGYIDNAVIENNDLRDNGTAGLWNYYPGRVRNSTIRNNVLSGTATTPTTTPTTPAATDTTAPPVPTLVSPANTAHTNDTTPFFDWTAVTDASAVYYQLLVDNNSDFSSPVINITRTTWSCYGVTTAMARGTYYWKVRAVDAAGNASAWTSTRYCITP